MRGHWQHLDIYRDFYFLLFFGPLSYYKNSWFHHASMNATLLGWCLGRGCYVCTFPAARASANRHSTALQGTKGKKKKKRTTFFTPLGLVLGDYLALLIYCVIIKLRYLDISSTSTMWLERERESNALNIFLVDNFLGSIEWQKGETFKQYWFCFHPFFERWINKIWFLQKSLQLPLKFHTTSWVLMVEMDISRGACLTGPHVQSSSKHLLTDQTIGMQSSKYPFSFTCWWFWLGFSVPLRCHFPQKIVGIW